jgi:hypothetical protein
MIVIATPRFLSVSRLLHRSASASLVLPIPTSAAVAYCVSSFPSSLSAPLAALSLTLLPLPSPLSLPFSSSSYRYQSLPTGLFSVRYREPRSTSTTRIPPFKSLFVASLLTLTPCQNSPRCPLRPDSRHANGCPHKTTTLQRNLLSSVPQPYDATPAAYPLPTLISASHKP